MSACPKMRPMGYFEDRLTALISEVDTSVYQIALSIGQDPARIGSILYLRKPATFEKRLETLKMIAESPLLKGKANFETMAAWLVRNYVPDETLRLAVEEKLDVDPDLKKAVEIYRSKGGPGTTPRQKKVFLQRTLWPQGEL